MRCPLQPPALFLHWPAFKSVSSSSVAFFLLHNNFLHLLLSHHHFVIIMDPASIVGLTGASLGIVKTLGDGIIAIKPMLRGVREVDEATRGLGDELDMF